MELQIASLNTFAFTLRLANDAVMNTSIPLSNARIARNDMLYGANTGMVDIALEVKKYIKSVFGGSSQQYHQVGELTFTRPRK